MTRRPKWVERPPGGGSWGLSIEIQPGHIDAGGAEADLEQLAEAVTWAKRENLFELLRDVARHLKGQDLMILHQRVLDAMEEL